MIAAGFLFFTIVLSALPFFASVRYGVRPEKIFLVSLLANGLVFYCFAAFGSCTAGAVAIAAANLILYVPALKRITGDGRNFLKKFFMPSVIVFYASTAVCFLATSVCRFIHWDEYSHWGIAPKLLFERGLLSCAFDNVLEHASYPPGLSVLEVMTQKLFFLTSFRESIVFFTIGVLMLACLIMPFAYAEKESGFFKSSFALVAGLSAAAIFLPVGFWSCESDCVLAIVFAAAVFVAMKAKGSRTDDVLTALLLAWLILIKKPGFGFAVMVLGVYLIRTAAFWKERTKRFQKVMPFIVSVFPFLVALSWRGLLKYHHTRIVFPAGKITLEGITNLLIRHEPEYAVNVAANFLGSFTPYLLLFLAVWAGFILYSIFFADKEERPCDLLWFLPVCFFLFSASLFLTYVFIFSESQAEKLVSYSRYVTSFLIMPYVLLVMKIFSSPKQHKFFNAISIGGTVSEAFCILALYTTYLGYALNPVGIDTLRRNRLETIESRYGMLLREKNASFDVITCDGNGQASYMMRYAFPDAFSEELCPVSKPDDYACSSVMTETELKKEFGKVSYVLFDVTPDNFVSDYKGLFAEQTKDVPEDTLYRVLPDGRLEKVSCH